MAQLKEQAELNKLSSANSNHRSDMSGNAYAKPVNVQNSPTKSTISGISHSSQQLFNQHHNQRGGGNYNGFGAEQMKHISQTDSFKSYSTNKGDQEDDGIKGRRKVHSQTRPSFMASSAGQQIVNGQSAFKPYTQKDFNRIQQVGTTNKMGGLGPNIGSEDWEKARTKQKMIQEFSHNIKNLNQNNIQSGKRQ